jgi:hypothetical protein
MLFARGEVAGSSQHRRQRRIAGGVRGEKSRRVGSDGSHVDRDRPRVRIRGAPLRRGHPFRISSCPFPSRPLPGVLAATTATAVRLSPTGSVLQTIPVENNDSDPRARRAVLWAAGGGFGGSHTPKASVTSTWRREPSSRRSIPLPTARPGWASQATGGLRLPVMRVSPLYRRAACSCFRWPSPRLGGGACTARARAQDSYTEPRRRRRIPREYVGDPSLRSG